MALPNDYAPGRCNSGPAEIRRRRMGGWAGVALTAAALAALILTGAMPAWYLLLFLPALAASVGFVQAAFRFCVYFGLSALFNFSEIGQEARVADADSRRRDRAQAWKLFGYSAVIAGAFAASAFAVASALA